MLPKVVEFQTISYCNSNCIICPWKDVKNYHSPELMTDSLFEKLLEELCNVNPDRVIPYLNNEPLLDKDIFDKLDKIRGAVPLCEIELSTNAILLNDKISRNIIESPIDDLHISMFGHDDESHKKMLGLKNVSHTKMVEEILNLRDLNNQRGDSRKLNVKIVKIINSPYLDDEKVMEDKKFWESEGFEVFLYGFLNRSGNLDVLDERDNSLPANGCELNRHKERIYIYRDGSVYFCCNDWSQEYCMGNINDNSISEIYNNSKYEKIRDMVDGKVDSPKEFLCKNCKLCGVKK